MPTLSAILYWLWTGTDHGPLRGPADIGGGLVLPVYATGPESLSWWASRLLGWPVIPVLMLWATAMALPAVGWIAFRAHRRLPSDLSGGEGEVDPLFITWLSLAIALVAALAIFWVAVPSPVLRPCG